MGVPLYVTCHFSLVAFNISVFHFCQFDYYVSQCVPLWVYPAWDSLCFLDLVDYCFPMFGKFSPIISSDIFSGPFSSSGTPIMQILVCLMLFQMSLRLSSFLFILFFCILFCGSDFYHSVLQVIYPFCLSYSDINSF